MISFRRLPVLFGRLVPGGFLVIRWLVRNRDLFLIIHDKLGDSSRCLSVFQALRLFGGRDPFFGFRLRGRG
jgi:hypothetical protein